MLAFISSMLLVAVAELGDKTQLLVLSFTTRYKLSKVLIGVGIALFGLQLLAVVAGQVLFRVVPINYLRIIIGISFIGFGIWIIKGEDEGKDVKTDASRLGAIASIALAFFLAELGDKTQLTTVSLAAKYHSFVGVWLGSTLGMIIADSAALVVGILAGRRLPQEKIRYFSATVLILFGILTLVQAFTS
ncbi:MAG: TMEM165/GDT1 family protein [Firmicutes bacterium]|nr:TMEM165/GDT1 family protein [Bacillota bacterium]